MTNPAPSPISAPSAPPVAPAAPPTVAPAPIPDPAAAAATASAPPPPKKRGRPPGAGDKAPRTRTRKAAAAGSAIPGGAASSSGAAGAFDGAAPGMADPAAAAASAGGVPVELAAMLDLKVAAPGLLRQGNALLAFGSSVRYPKEIAALVPLTDEEIEQLEPLLLAWAATSNVKVDPGTAFVGLLAITLGSHILIAERALRQARASGVQTSAPKPPPSKPAVVDSEAARTEAAA